MTWYCRVRCAFMRAARGRRNEIALTEHAVAAMGFDVWEGWLR